MSINHIATNLVTKGLLNISNITKGMILVGYEIVFKKRGGSSADVKKTIPLHYERESLYNEIKRHDEEDIELIKVYVDWNKNGKGFRKIEAKLLRSQIEAEILNETRKKIKVQILN